MLSGSLGYMARTPWVVTLPVTRRRRLPAQDGAMIFQEPTTSLKPRRTIGFQSMEARPGHVRGSLADRRDRALGLLDQVGIPSPAGRRSSFPHQLSGGM